MNEQPNSATKARLWKTVSCHRSYARARLNTATGTKHSYGISEESTTDFKAAGISSCAVQALLKKHKKGNADNHRSSGQPKKPGAAGEQHIYCRLFLIEVPSAQSWQKPLGPRYRVINGTNVEKAFTFYTLYISGD